MDFLKEKIEAIVEKIKKDPDFAKKFQEEPVKAMEEILGVDLPDDKIKELIEAVKLKLNLDENELFGKIKGLFQ